MSRHAQLRLVRLAARFPQLGLALAFKYGYIPLLLVGLALWSDFDLAQFHAVNARWPRQRGPVFASHFATWDGAHYLLLSELGYARDVPSCAFYPLWPLVMRATAPVFGGSHVIAGLVLSNLFSLVAWGLFYRLVRWRWGEKAAMWALVFLIAFPGGLFFQFIYTESLFLLLLMGLWLALEDRRYGLAAVCAGLLPLCRGVGAFAVLPLAWHAFTVAPPGWFDRLRARGAEWWGRLKAWRRQSAGEAAAPREGPDGKRGAQGTATGVPGVGRVPPEGGGAGTEGLNAASDGGATHQVGEPGLPGTAVWTPWVLVGMPVLGWGVYLALMWHWTGNPFEGFEAQKHWKVHSVHNLWDVSKFVIGFFTPTVWHGFTGSLLDRCVFVLLLYTLPMLWRLDKGLLVWAYMLGILPAMSGTFTSFIRFASCAFPMFIALGVVLSRREWRGLRYVLLVVFVVLHLVLVWRFVNFRWAG